MVLSLNQGDFPLMRGWLLWRCAWRGRNDRETDSAGAAGSCWLAFLALGAMPAGSCNADAYMLAVSCGFFLPRRCLDKQTCRFLSHLVFEAHPSSPAPQQHLRPHLFQAPGLHLRPLSLSRRPSLSARPCSPPHGAPSLAGTAPPSPNLTGGARGHGGGGGQ